MASWGLFTDYIVASGHRAQINEDQESETIKEMYVNIDYTWKIFVMISELLRCGKLHPCCGTKKYSQIIFLTGFLLPVYISTSRRHPLPNFSPPAGLHSQTTVTTGPSNSPLSRLSGASSVKAITVSGQNSITQHESTSWKLDAVRFRHRLGCGSQRMLQLNPREDGGIAG